MIESVVYNRIREVVIDKIKDYQYGGMKGRGVIPQLLTLVDSINGYRLEEGTNTRGNIRPTNYVVLVLLDCSKAFDVFNRVVLLSRLIKYGVGGKLLEWIAAFFEKRFQKVRLGEVFSNIDSPERGGPQGSVITLLCFLIIINNVGEGVEGGEADLNLFMDDVGFVEYGKDAAEVVRKINARLAGVYTWSRSNGIAFPFKKFHLINIGRRKLSGKWKKKVRYGGQRPPWVLKAKYLGVIVDHHLHFRTHMDGIADRVRKVMFMMYNHGNFRTGCAPVTLERKFKSYIMPHFLSGLPCWIFSIREKFRYDQPLVHGYGRYWLELRRLYRRCARIVLGVRKNTSGEAVLARLGWLPLDYELALHGLRWYLKWHHGRIGSTAPSPSYHFAVRARELLAYLIELTGYDLFAERITRDDTLLRDALYKDVNRCWKVYEGAEVTRRIHPDWSTGVDLGMVTRYGRSLVHGEACGNGNLRNRDHGCDGPGGGMCRHGCGDNETLDHVLFDCPIYSKERSEMRRICSNLGICYNIQAVFTRKELLPLAEELFLRIAND